MTITILVDNPGSWIMPYAERLRDALSAKHDARLVRDQRDLRSGDLAVFLSCEKLVPKETLAKNARNVVVHESALPRGKGWSPLTWQILEGAREVPIALFEASEKVDSGPIYAQETMRFEGHELVDELRKAQGEATIRLVERFVAGLPDVEGAPQSGKESFYPRRGPKDSELDPEKPIAGQFDLLRVVDNERYPAFFRHRGHTYVVRIEKDDDYLKD